MRQFINYKMFSLIIAIWYITGCAVDVGSPEGTLPEDEKKDQTEDSAETTIDPDKRVIDGINLNNLKISIKSTPLTETGEIWLNIVKMEAVLDAGDNFAFEDLGLKMATRINIRDEASFLDGLFSRQELPFGKYKGFIIYLDPSKPGEFLDSEGSELPIVLSERKTSMFLKVEFELLEDGGEQSVELVLDFTSGLERSEDVERSEDRMSEGFIFTPKDDVTIMMIDF